MLFRSYRQVSLYAEYQDDPLEKLRESVADDGILPDHYDQMAQAELKAFERMCRRLEKYLQAGDFDEIA